MAAHRPKADPGLGAILRALRQRPRAGRPSGLPMSEAARLTAAEGADPVSDSFWGLVEKGKSNASGSVLLRMALAVDAQPYEIAELFRAAGYGLLHDALVNLGAHARADSFYGAPAGILTDSRLPHTGRQRLLDHYQDILEALRARDEAPPTPDQAKSPGQGG